MVERQGDAVLLHCEQTAYLSNQVCLRLHQRGHDVYKAWLTDIPPRSRSFRYSKRVRSGSSASTGRRR